MKFLIRSLIVMTAAFGFASVVHADQTVSFDSPSGSTKFLALGRPQALRIRGEGDGPTGKIKIVGTSDMKASGELHFNIDSLKTGIDMRDEHMKEKYLETGKFKDAILTLTDVPVDKKIAIGTGETSDTPFTGKLKLHGVEKDVTGHFKSTRGADGKVNVQAQFTVKLPDYGIEIPKYLGITVAEDVTVDIDANGKIQ